MTEEFERLAKAAESHGPGGTVYAQAAQIRAFGVQYSQQAELISTQKTVAEALVYVNKEFARLDKTVSGLEIALKSINSTSEKSSAELCANVDMLRNSIDTFNRESGKLYCIYLVLTFVIALATVVNAVAILMPHAKP